MDDGKGITGMFIRMELDPQNMTAAFVCLFGMECGGRKLTENEI